MRSSYLVRRSGRALGLPLLAALAACSGTPSPPMETPAAAPAVAPPPKLSLVEDEPSVPAAPPPPPAEPLPPLTRRFEPLPLPPDVAEIRAVAGRSARDVWMMTARGDLLHWDGATFSKIKGPACPPPPGATSYAAPVYGRLSLLPGEIVAGGTHEVSMYEREHRAMVTARSQGAGAWSCTTFGVAGYDERTQGPQHFAVGASLLRFTVFAPHEPHLTLDDRRLPLLDAEGYGLDLLRHGAYAGGRRDNFLLAARTADDLWLYDTRSGHVVHGNGVGWEARPSGVAPLRELWVDEHGAAWGAGPGAMVRWDHGERAWRHLPVPANLDARFVRGSGRDVWLVGTTAIHQWDGEALRRGAAPLAGVNDVWAGPEGELWIVGADPTRRVRQGKQEVPAGAVFHALAAPPAAPPAPAAPTSKASAPPPPEKADAPPGGPLIADERGVALEGPDHRRLWSVALRLYPTEVPAAAKRVAAVDAGGAVLTGASDGSLVGLDRDGQPRFQLGVRGAVSAIKVAPAGGFEVTSSVGLALVDADGVVHADTTANPRVPSVAPTLAYRVQRAGPPEGPAFTDVRHALAMAPDDVWAIVGYTNVHHQERGTWSAFGSAAVPLASPIENSQPLATDGLARSPSGSLLIVGIAHTRAPHLLTWASPAYPRVLERVGQSLRERRDISAVAGYDDADGPAGRAAIYAVSAAGREILCMKAACLSRRLSPAARPGRGAEPQKAVDETRWTRFEWPLPPGQPELRPMTFAGEALWAADFVDEHGRLLRDGKVVLESLSSGPLPSVKALFARGEDDVWALAGPLGSFDAELLVHWDGKTFTSTKTPVTPIRSVWASGRDDVWLVGTGGVVRFDGQRWRRIAGIAGDVSFVTGTGPGDVWIGGGAGLWHVTPDADARPDLEGAKAPPPPAGAPGRVLAVRAGGPSFRLERVVLDVEGGAPLRGALEIAPGPGGVLWLHDGHRIVEHDGTRTRLLHTRHPLEPLRCHRCLAPSGPGEGALLATDLRAVTARKVSAELGSLPVLQALARAPSGAFWAVSAGNDDSLPHALTKGPEGLRLVSGVPAAAYADVAVRADDDVWMAGGLNAAPSDGVRIWPAGEGTLVHFDGQGFTRHRAPDGALLSVAATGPGEAWAVGVAGSVLHVKGASVEAFRLERPVTLRAVAAGKDDVWIAGDRSTLLRWDGTALQRIDAGAAGVDAALTAVIPPVGARSGWVVGPAGIWRVVRSP